MQAPLDQLQLRQRPSAHDFTWTPNRELEVVLGFSSGEIMSYQPLKKSQPTTQYSRGSFESTSAVTDIRWAPGRPGCFVAAHAHGTLLVYDLRRAEANATGNGRGHQAQPLQTAAVAQAGADGQATSASGGSDDGAPGTNGNGGAPAAPAAGRRGHMRKASSNERRGFSLFRSSPAAEDSRKQAAGPSACWHICQCAINQLEFSHSGRHLAMVSADGLLRVFEFASEQLIASFHSFYAGLLCVAWSLDDAYLLVSDAARASAGESAALAGAVAPCRLPICGLSGDCSPTCHAPPAPLRAPLAAQTGGEDDLVSVWSFSELRLVARAAGHSSWVTAVQFDPYAPGGGGAQTRVGITSAPPAQAARVSGNCAADGCGSSASSQLNGHGRSESGGAQPRRAERLSASLAAAVAGPPVRKLAFGSVGMDAKLLLWEMEVEQPEMQLMRNLELRSPAGAQVTVSHARGVRASERAGASGNGRGVATVGAISLATSRIGRLPTSPVTHEPQFSVEASPTGAVPSPAFSVSAKGEVSAARLNARSMAAEQQGARTQPGHLVVAAVPMSATAVLKPIGGVAAHAEPVTHLAFTQSSILTAGLDGTIRVWIPRIPPGTAPPADSAAPALTFNLVTVQTTPQQIIYANSTPCYIDPALTASTSPRQARLSY